MPPVREHDVLYDEEDSEGLEIPGWPGPVVAYTPFEDEADDDLPPLVDKPPTIEFHPPPPGFFPLAPPTTYEISDFDAAIKSSPPATPYITFTDDDRDEGSETTNTSVKAQPSMAIVPRSPQRTRIRKPVARDPSYIPRPPNAFILFRSSFIRDQRVPGDVEGNSTNLSKIIGICWKKLSREERAEWEAKAEQAQIDHRRRYPDWRFRPAALAARRGRLGSGGTNRGGGGRQRKGIGDEPGVVLLTQPGSSTQAQPEAQGEPTKKDIWWLTDKEKLQREKAKERKKEVKAKLAALGREAKIADLIEGGVEGRQLEPVIAEWDEESKASLARAAAKDKTKAVEKPPTLLQRRPVFETSSLSPTLSSSSASHSPTFHPAYSSSAEDVAENPPSSPPCESISSASSSSNIPLAFGLQNSAAHSSPGHAFGTFQADVGPSDDLSFALGSSFLTGDSENHSDEDTSAVPTRRPSSVPTASPSLLESVPTQTGIPTITTSVSITNAPLENVFDHQTSPSLFGVFPASLQLPRQSSLPFPLISSTTSHSAGAQELDVPAWLYDAASADATLRPSSPPPLSPLSNPTHDSAQAQPAGSPFTQQFLQMRAMAGFLEPSPSFDWFQFPTPGQGNASNVNQAAFHHSALDRSDTSGPRESLPYVMVNTHPRFMYPPPGGFPTRGRSIHPSSGISGTGVVRQGRRGTVSAYPASSASSFPSAPPSRQHRKIPSYQGHFLTPDPPHYAHSADSSPKRSSPPVFLPSQDDSGPPNAGGGFTFPRWDSSPILPTAATASDMTMQPSSMHDHVYSGVSTSGGGGGGTSIPVFGTFGGVYGGLNLGADGLQRTASLPTRVPRMSDPPRAMFSELSGWAGQSYEKRE